jgi:hypothetical protein
MTSPSTLNKIVENAVTTYRQLFLALTILLLTILLLTQNFLGALVAGPLLLGGYHLGLRALGWSLSKLLDPTFVSKSIQAERLQEINDRLKAGTLEADTEEFESLMSDVGLEIPPTVVEYGPVFGKQFDHELHEFILARKGLKGEVHRFEYLGQAQYENGAILTPLGDGEAEYIIVDESLYERKLSAEPRNPVVQEAKSDVQ